MSKIKKLVFQNSDAQIKPIIEKSRLLENITKCDIKIPDIIQVILKIKEKGYLE